jgi:MFS family permease
VSQLRYIYLVAPAVFLVAIAITGVQSLQAGFMRKQIEGLLSVPPAVIALSFIMANLAMIVTQYKIAAMKDRSLNLLLVISSSALFVSLLLLCFSKHWMQTLSAFILFGVCSAGIRISLMSLLCMKNKDRKKTGIAVINILQTTGYAIGGYIMSYTSLHSYALSYKTLAVFSLLLFIFVLLAIFKLLNNKQMKSLTD